MPAPGEAYLGSSVFKFITFMHYSECFLIEADEQMSSSKGPDLSVVLSKPWREPPLWNEQVASQIYELIVIYRLN